MSWKSLKWIFMHDIDTNCTTKNIFILTLIISLVCFERFKEFLLLKKNMTSLHLKSWKRWKNLHIHEIFILILRDVQLQWLSRGIIMNNSKSVTMKKFFKTLHTHTKKVEEEFKKEPSAASTFFLCINSTESEQKKTLKFMPLISISWLKASLSLIAIKIN